MFEDILAILLTVTFPGAVKCPTGQATITCTMIHKYIRTSTYCIVSIAWEIHKGLPNVQEPGCVFALQTVVSQPLNFTPVWGDDLNGTISYELDSPVSRYQD